MLYLCLNVYSARLLHNSHPCLTSTPSSATKHAFLTYRPKPTTYTIADKTTNNTFPTYRTLVKKCVNTKQRLVRCFEIGIRQTLFQSMVCLDPMPHLMDIITTVTPQNRISDRRYFLSALYDRIDGHCSDTFHRTFATLRPTQPPYMCKLNINSNKKVHNSRKWSTIYEDKTKAMQLYTKKTPTT